MGSLLKIPVVGPLTSSNFPEAGKYDPLAIEPLDWNLRMTLAGGQPIQMQAVCDGMISTVPPGEVIGSEFVTIGLEEAARPSKVRYFLEPHPAIIRLLSRHLSGLRLGESVKWFVFEEVDTTDVAQSFKDELDSYRWQQQWENSHYLPSDEAEKAFLLGQLKLQIRKGDPIGSTVLAADNMHRFKFGVFTTNGYIDPVYFFDVLQDLIDGDEETDAAALNALIGTDWPFLAQDGNVNTLIYEAENKAYPNAVLQEAKERLIWVSEEIQWREIANAQKVHYLERLYNSATGSFPSFVYNTEEMINPYQLEAVVEFFTFWNDPGISSSPPAIDDFTTLQAVDFGSSDNIHLVLIDAFNDTRLGSPPLPKPEWTIEPWVQQGNACDLLGPLSPYPPDEFNGVLFLLYKGQIKEWHRWTSYSSHRWEDDGEEGCYYASSIQGNVKYKFWSRTSANSKNINYGLCAWYDGNDATILARRPANVDPDTWVPGKFYYRGGTPDDQDGKTEAIFHFGLTLHDTTTARALQTSHQYNGSGGCIVSPSYYQFRRQLIHWYFQENISIDEDERRLLEKIQNTNIHSLSAQLFFSSEKQALSDAWGSNDTKANGYTIAGTFWLIRPDEPTQK